MCDCSLSLEEERCRQKLTCWSTSWRIVMSGRLRRMSVCSSASTLCPRYTRWKYPTFQGWLSCLLFFAAFFSVEFFLDALFSSIRANFSYKNILFQNVVQKLSSVKERVDRLEEDCDFVGIRVENANNAFLLLSNTQFIENRVHDDDPANYVKPAKSPEVQYRQLVEATFVFASSRHRNRSSPCWNQEFWKSLSKHWSKNFEFQYCQCFSIILLKILRIVLLDSSLERPSTTLQQCSITCFIQRRHQNRKLNSRSPKSWTRRWSLGWKPCRWRLSGWRSYNTRTGLLMAPTGDFFIFIFIILIPVKRKNTKH